MKKSEDRRLNIGIIGYGVMGKIRYHAMKEIGGCNILKICDVAPVECPKDVEFTTNYMDIINDKNINCIFVCTPNFLLKELVVGGLYSGKHVFCEKPPGRNLRELDEMIEAENNAPGLKLMFGFNHRHHDSVIHAKKLIDSGKYGRLLWMRGRYGKSVDKNFFKTWRADKKLAGGGILLDQGIHMLDLFVMMAGNFDEVKAHVSDLYWHLDVEDNVFALYRNSKNGVVASLHSTMTQWRHLFSFEIFLEKGYITINGLLTNSGTYGEEAMSIAENRSVAPAATWSKEEDVKYKVNNSWRSEVKMFFKAIKDDTIISVGNSKDAWKLMKLIETTYAER